MKGTIISESVLQLSTQRLLPFAGKISYYYGFSRKAHFKIQPLPRSLDLIGGAVWLSVTQDVESYNLLNCTHVQLYYLWQFKKVCFCFLYFFFLHPKETKIFSGEPELALEILAFILWTIFLDPVERDFDISFGIDHTCHLFSYVSSLFEKSSMPC